MVKKRSAKDSSSKKVLYMKNLRSRKIVKFTRGKHKIQRKRRSKKREQTWSMSREGKGLWSCLNSERGRMTMKWKRVAKFPNQQKEKITPS